MTSGRTPLTPLAVANTFIARHGPLQHMKVQKLTYFAYGWWLGLRDARLTDEGPQVWRYGPVFRSVYSALTHHGRDAIAQPEISDPFSDEPPLVADDVTDVGRFLNWIWIKYGRFSGGQLSDQTHMQGTPWYEIAKRHNFSVPLYLEMDDDTIRSYFRRLARAEGVTTAAA